MYNDPFAIIPGSIKHKEILENQKQKQDVLIKFLQLPANQKEKMLEYAYDSLDKRLLDFFFKMNLNEHQIKKLLLKLNYNFHSDETPIFKYKDYGDKMYLIIRGQVGVYIPNHKYDSSKKTTHENELSKTQNTLKSNENSRESNKPLIKSTTNSKRVVVNVPSLEPSARSSFEGNQK